MPLGLWTLREACLQLKAWRERMPDADTAWVSINLSAPQFNQPSLVDDIAQALRDTGLPARCLVVELTEGVAMENPTAVKGQLMQLRVMGVKIALDDFGTGQSSLAYLHQFPADKLKLDRSFVCDMETRNDVRDIVGAVTGLAHQLGLEVIAEGVETGGQLDQVRSLGCEYVQGYFFSKPVDRERAAELLRTGFPPLPGSERVAAPATGAAVEESDSTHKRTGSRPRMSRALYVSAAAVLVLALAGLVARFTGQPPQGGPHRRAPRVASRGSGAGDAGGQAARRTRTATVASGDAFTVRREAGRIHPRRRAQARPRRVRGTADRLRKRCGVCPGQSRGQGRRCLQLQVRPVRAHAVRGRTHDQVQDEDLSLQGR